jgi:hypothetical protein
MCFRADRQTETTLGGVLCNVRRGRLSRSRPWLPGRTVKTAFLFLFYIGAAPFVIALRAHATGGLEIYAYRYPNRQCIARATLLRTDTGIVRAGERRGNGDTEMSAK